MEAEGEAIITRFIQDHVAAAGADGLVLGMSGGLDSAVVGCLAARALGPGKVTAYWLPGPESSEEDREHADLAARHAGIEIRTVAIAPFVAAAEQALPAMDVRARGNVKARARMTILYALAEGRLVCGTGNKSELLVGYFTKHGDGGVDLLPIGDLYKTQVAALARHLGVPDPIIDKPPSAGLAPGQTDEEELGTSYGRLDRILKGIELNQDALRIAAKTGEPVAEVERVQRMVRATEHKRRSPLVPKIGARTVGLDWRRSVH